MSNWVCGLRNWDLGGAELCSSLDTHTGHVRAYGCLRLYGAVRSLLVRIVLALAWLYNSAQGLSRAQVAAEKQGQGGADLYPISV